eukprot:4559101-Pleurochrysis_carterae.AAC.2
MGRASGDEEIGIAVPVAAKMECRGSCKSRPPAMKYTWTRHKPNTQGKVSGDEVMARARAPTKSAAWCVSARVR